MTAEFLSNTDTFKEKRELIFSQPTTPVSQKILGGMKSDSLFCCFYFLKIKIQGFK